MNKILRNYVMSDADMLELAKKVAASYKKDWKEFKTFDSTFDKNIGADLEVAIKEAEKIESDEVITEHLAKLTANLKDATEECVNLYKRFKYFVKKAYPNDKDIHDKFGFKNFYQARTSKKKFISFMKDMETNVNEHREDLEAVGCTGGLFEQVKPAIAALEKAVKEQEDYKAVRVEKTKQRIQLYNEVWKHVSIINDLAGIIYPKGSEKYYRYFPEKKEEVEEVED